LFDTHPSDRDRVASARLEDTAGVFALPKSDEDLPAAALFADFDGLSKAVSLQFYRENLGDEFTPKLMHPVEDLIRRQQAEDEAREALARYFQVEIPELRPLPISESAAEYPDDAKAIAEQVRSARKQMLDELPEYRKLTKRYSKAENTLYDLTAALAILQAGLRLPNPADYGLERGTLKEATARIRRTRNALATLAARLLAFETLAAERLSAALRLLQHPKVVERIETGERLQEELELLLPDAQFVADTISELPTFRLLYISVVTLFGCVENNRDNRDLFEAVKSKIEAIRRRLISLRGQLKDRLYPFDHARADMTLREYALPRIPDEEEPFEILDVTGEMFSKLVQVQVRFFARLAYAAEQVEKAIGLEPLPLPETEEEDEDGPES
ncbi:MAG: hypothetical protein KY476_20020, partial [Planctomycetes bacterium]|nr:hypothetical protein [Planctomycetota bacterium]